VPLTQTQLAGAVADRAEISRAEAKRVLDALEDVVLDEIANAEKVRPRTGRSHRRGTQAPQSPRDGKYRG
jgi:nucleoid DNA-binding protein